MTDDVEIKTGDNDRIEYDRETTMQKAGFREKSDRDSIVFSIADLSAEVTEQFGFHPEKCKLLCLHLTKKDFILVFQFLIVLTVVGAYFAYELNEYLDTKSNRKEYTNSDSVASMPLPFVYIEFDIDDYSCMVEPVLVVDGVNESLITNYTRFNDIKGASMEYILDNFTNDDWQLIYQISNTTRSTTNEQFLIIPSNTDSTIETGSKDTLDIYIKCYSDSGDNSSSIDDAYDHSVWYIFENKDQLYNFNNITHVFDWYYYSADYVYSGYDVKFTYQWYTYDNRVDSGFDVKDYFIAGVESTFVVESDDPNVISLLQVSPISTGIQTTFVTAQSIDFLKIFSLTGGMFTGVNSILALLVVYLVWGFNFKFISFGGIAPNASPPDIEIRKIRSYVERHMREYVRSEFDLRDVEIQILKKINKKLLKHVGLLPQQAPQQQQAGVAQSQVRSTLRGGNYKARNTATEPLAGTEMQQTIDIKDSTDTSLQDAGTRVSVDGDDEEPVGKSTYTSIKAQLEQNRPLSLDVNHLDDLQLDELLSTLDNLDTIRKSHSMLVRDPAHLHTKF